MCANPSIRGHSMSRLVHIEYNPALIHTTYMLGSVCPLSYMRTLILIVWRPDHARMPRHKLHPKRSGKLVEAWTGTRCILRLFVRSCTLPSRSPWCAFQLITVVFARNKPMWGTPTDYKPFVGAKRLPRRMCILTLPAVRQPSVVPFVGR